MGLTVSYGQDSESCSTGRIFICLPILGPTSVPPQLVPIPYRHELAALFKLTAVGVCNRFVLSAP